METGIRGKVALVAAASKGLGYASARALAFEGAHVVLCSRSSDAVLRATDAITSETGMPVTGVSADVTSEDGASAFVSAAIGAFGRCDILVANAGGPPPGPFESLSDAQWRDAFELSFLSTARLVRLVLPHMRTAKFGRIVAITSASVLKPVENLTLSNAIRPAVIGLMHDLAPRIAADGITFNSLAPGFTRTERVQQVLQQQAAAQQVTLAEAERQRISAIPAGRIGSPDDFGATVAFLCGAQAGFITGQTIAVDGGFSCY